MSKSRPLPQLIMRFPDLEALQQEIEGNLSSGRAFVSGPAEVSEREACALVLIHPDSEASLELAAQAVYVNPDEPGAGVGLELARFDDETLERLEDFARAEKPKSEDKPGDLYSRVRHFTAPEQLRSAREGDYAERVALERVYGKSVWEVLVRPPSARIWVGNTSYWWATTTSLSYDTLRSERSTGSSE